MKQGLLKSPSIETLFTQGDLKTELFRDNSIYNLLHSFVFIVKTVDLPSKVVNFDFCKFCCFFPFPVEIRTATVFPEIQWKVRAVFELMPPWLATRTFLSQSHQIFNKMEDLKVLKSTDGFHSTLFNGTGCV